MRQKSKSPLYCIKSTLSQNFLPCLHPVAQLQCFSCSNSRGQQLSTTVEFTDTSRSSCETAFKFTNAANYNNIPQRFTSFLHLTHKCNKTNKHTNFSVISTSVPVIILNTHTHTFNGPFSGTTQVSWYQKGKTNLDFTEARDSEWQWHQLGHMQVCTSLQTDNHISTPPLSFLQAGCPSCHPTNSVKALKAMIILNTMVKNDKAIVCLALLYPTRTGNSFSTHYILTPGFSLLYAASSMPVIN